jgi:uncharacterized protein YgiM (DUF1202 family)
MAYDGSIETCGNDFKDPERNASSNYGIDSKGRRGLYVEEKNGSWCSSNKENDMHAITVEIACERVHPYKMTDKAIESYIELTVDCMKRNNLNKITYLGSLEATRAYKRADGEALMTLHRWYAAENGKPKACPGDYFISKIPYVISEINKRLAPPKVKECFGKLTVLQQTNVRKEPDNNSELYKVKIKGQVINVVATVNNEWYKTINGNYVRKDSRVSFKESHDITVNESKLFKEKSTGSKVLEKIPSKSKVLNIEDTNSGWSKVWYNDKIGFVKNVNLKDADKLSKYVPYTVKNDIWLRKKPSVLSMYKMKKIHEGDEVKFVCSYNGKYSQVIYKNKTYYVLNSKFIKSMR